MTATARHDRLPWAHRTTRMLKAVVTGMAATPFGTRARRDSGRACRLPKTDALMLSSCPAGETIPVDLFTEGLSSPANSAPFPSTHWLSRQRPSHG